MRASLPRSLLTGWHPPGGARVWLQAGCALAILLVVAGWADRERSSAGRLIAIQAAVPLAERAALEHCSESATWVHDVRWAAACMALAEHDPMQDGSAECELPPEAAARLNLMLQEAEQRCVLEAKAPPAP